MARSRKAREVAGTGMAARADDRPAKLVRDSRRRRHCPRPGLVPKGFRRACAAAGQEKRVAARGPATLAGLSPQAPPGRWMPWRR